MAGTVAFILKGYPRLSETFIAQEIRELEKRGLAIEIISLRFPTDTSVHPVHREITAPVRYLPEYLYREPARVWRGLAAGRRSPGWTAALGQWLHDLARDPTPNRVRRFGQALVLARELAPEITHLHAHFMHTPASVARYTALLTGLPWSFSAHARDIWTTPDREKAEKMAAAAWGAVCTTYARDHLAALAGGAAALELAYHGLDFARFPPQPPVRPARRGDDSQDPVVLLTVGRAVEKKGIDDLLDALARLPAALSWRLVHVGGGPLLKQLKRRARRHGLVNRISWLGARPQEDVFAQYAAADLFVLACRRARDKDQDGLPNVLLEAQAYGLPCVATDISAIPELLKHGDNGLLVPVRDTAALAAALARLIADPDLRLNLGAAGALRVRQKFAMTGGLDRLAARFGLAGN